jgi:AraC-like DNA-binding protein
MDRTTTSEKTWQAFAGTIASTIYRSSYASQAQQLHLFLSGIDHCSFTDWAFMQAALELLYTTRGQVRMEELATHCGHSLRQVQRRFKQIAGLTPKTLARLIRFEAIRHRLLTQPSLCLTELAYEFGYSDQAHFIHDFKVIAGCTPQAFIEMARKRSMSPFYNVPRHYPPILSVHSTNERNRQ